MLRQASVSDLIMDRVSRGPNTYIVITMRRYPRFVNRALRDAYTPEMSPEPSLHEDWLSAKRKHDDHDGAFARTRYEKRFTISEAGLEYLKRYAKLSREKDVYFVCSCRVGQRCHREMVLLLARKWLGAETDAITNDYPELEARLTSLEAIVRSESAGGRPLQRVGKNRHSSARGPAPSRMKTQP